MFRVLAEGYSFVQIPHLKPSFLFFPRFFTGGNFLGFFPFFGFFDFRWAKIGEIFRGNCEYIISLSISCAIMTVVSLVVGTSLVFVFLVTSGVSCIECNLFFPLITKSVIDFCILGLGLLGLFFELSGVLARGIELLGSGSVPPWVNLFRFEKL